VTDHLDPRHDADLPEEDGELTPMEVEAPRRAASAQLVVAEGDTGEASVRAAMDPANQSLGDALRLSYRVLQLVMVILIGLFLFSGFQNVDEGRVGVRTLFGDIYGPPGQEQLGPGLTPFWPYPVGEIVTVPNRRVLDMSRVFWPTYPPGSSTLEAATERAEASSPIRPGVRPDGDGSLLTADGDIAHLGLTIDVAMTDVVDLLRNVAPNRLDAVVNRVVRRATVHVAAERSLMELVDARDEPALAIRDKAQAWLQELGTGVSITSVTLPSRSAPLAVRRTFAEVQNAREDAKTAIEQARQSAEEALTRAAGAQFPAMLALVDEYEVARATGDTAAADEVLERLKVAMEDRSASGDVTRIIAQARSFQSQLESSIGSDAERFSSLLPAFLENPELIVRQLWFDAIADSMGQSRMEIMPLPADLGQLMVRATSSLDVMNARRQWDIERRRREADGSMLESDPYMLRGRDIMIDRPGRRLDPTARTGREIR